MGGTNYTFRLEHRAIAPATEINHRFSAHEGSSAPQAHVAKSPTLEILTLSRAPNIPRRFKRAL
jgi:hypothetical protein